MRLEVAHTDYATLHAKPQKTYVLSFNESNIVDEAKIAELDAALREKFLQPKRAWDKPRGLIINLEKVSIMDVGAIGKLLKFLEALQEKGDRWVTINAQPSVWAALDALKKVEVFNVQPNLTEEEAIEKTIQDRQAKAREARHAL